MSEEQPELGGRDASTGADNLFLVRLWDEKQAGAETVWRGRLLHVITGRAHSFSCWSELINMLSGDLYPASGEAPELASGGDEACGSSVE